MCKNKKEKRSRCIKQYNHLRKGQNADFCKRLVTTLYVYRIYSRNSRHGVIHAFNTTFKKKYRYNQIYLRKIVSSHKSRTLNLDTKLWLKKCVNYASKYGISTEEKRSVRGVKDPGSPLSPFPYTSL